MMKLRDDGLVMREIDGETVLLDLVSSTYFASNRTGSFLLELLRTDRDRDSLISELAHEFGISLGEATADTDAFVAMLEEQDLLL
jgi:hypothetical protein